MNAISGEEGVPDAEGGPMWGRFFESIGGDDTESVMSGSHAHHDPHSYSTVGRLSHVQQSPQSEVHPNDSASVMDDDGGSVLDAYPRQHAAHGSSILVDDGTYVFKFRTPGGRTHRFQSRHDDVEHLREIVAGKLATDPFFTESHTGGDDSRPDPNDFLLSYTDADGDTVLVSSDMDVTDAVKIARAAGTDRVVLYLQGGKGWKETPEKANTNPEVPNPAPELKELETVHEIEPSPPVLVPPPAPESSHKDEVFGIPKDLLLPASIGALAIAIIGVFTISRLSSN